MLRSFSAVRREAGELGERVALPRVVQVSGSGPPANGKQGMLRYRDGVAVALGPFSSQAAPVG